MALEKIGELPDRMCSHPEHQPPNMICLPDGVYRHTCPGCGVEMVFTVANPRCAS